MKKKIYPGAIARAKVRDQEDLYQPDVNARPWISSPCLQGAQSCLKAKGKWLHSHLARLSGEKWKGKKIWLRHRVFLLSVVLLDWKGVPDLKRKKKKILLTIKHFHTPAPTKPGTNMSSPPRLLQVACIFPQFKFDLVHSLSDRYLQVTNFLSQVLTVSPRDEQPQNCVPGFLFLWQASLLGNKKKKGLSVTRELVKTNRHKANYTYLCVNYPFHCVCAAQPPRWLMPLPHGKLL